MANDYYSKLKQLEYNDLKAKAIEHLKVYLGSGRGDLNSLKNRFCKLVPDRKRKKVATVEELLQTLEHSNVIHIDDVLLLRDLARLLELKDLQDIIDEYDFNHCAGYKKVFKGKKVNLSILNKDSLHGLWLNMFLFCTFLLTIFHLKHQSWLIVNLFNTLLNFSLNDVM
ncbi:uncharacterized protein LOC110249565 [Exaiptasia diaphana]|uniref:Uncharacterized protein n=1 Tax=Exaiptasia diaphana TaxID=2652724 RepID=A0A913XYK1_EXADI|nr:uncharacterized protein LOC110249565 [Exaiptasia diaphana]